MQGTRPARGMRGYKGFGAKPECEVEQERLVHRAQPRLFVERPNHPLRVAEDRPEQQPCRDRPERHKRRQRSRRARDSIGETEPEWTDPTCSEH